MEAYAEGFNILRKANAGKRSRPTDAETTPLRNPEYYQYELDLPEIAEVWRRGSVIRSWLLDLTAVALLEDPDLKTLKAGFRILARGAGQSQLPSMRRCRCRSLARRCSGVSESRGEADYADRLLSALRKQFGGHAEKKG